MTFKVTFLPGNSYSVKQLKSSDHKATFLPESSYSAKPVQTKNLKVSFGYNLEIMPRYLNELYDVQISGNNDKYVLMYDSVSGKWRNVNPDIVLSAASSTESTQPGLPNDFINTLDVDLDDRIDLDAGGF